MEYIKSEKDYLNSPKYLKDREYWLEKFKDKPLLISMKLRDKDYYGSKAKRQTFVLEGKEAKDIRLFCKENSTSHAVLLEAALSIYVNRFLENNNITIGAPILNRSSVREKATTGMFISTVPIKITVDPSQSFADLCKKIGKEHMEVFRHQKYPYNILLSEVRKKHNIAHNLYDITVSYQNAKIIKAGHNFDFHTNGTLMETWQNPSVCTLTIVTIQVFLFCTSIISWIYFQKRK